MLRSGPAHRLVYHHVHVLQESLGGTPGYGFEAMGQDGVVALPEQISEHVVILLPFAVQDARSNVRARMSSESLVASRKLFRCRSFILSHATSFVVTECLSTAR
jgi:hypothetical protein